MGKYADKLAASRKHMSAEAIRREKCERSKARNATRRAERRAKAEEIVAGWQSLSYEDQLKTLDRRFGKGVGATKQRAKIAKRIEERDAKKAEEAKATKPKKPKSDRPDKKSRKHSDSRQS